MTVEPEFLVEHLSQYRISLEEATTVLDAIDQAGIYQIYRDSLTCVMWDRQTPINGVQAAKVLANRREIRAEHSVLLISDGTGKVLYFQPTLNELDSEALVDAIATSHARGLVISEATRQLAPGYGH